LGSLFAFDRKYIYSINVYKEYKILPLKFLPNYAMINTGSVKLKEKIFTEEKFISVVLLVTL